MWKIVMIMDNVEIMLLGITPSIGTMHHPFDVFNFHQIPTKDQWINIPDEKPWKIFHGLNRQKKHIYW